MLAVSVGAAALVAAALITLSLTTGGREHAPVPAAAQSGERPFVGIPQRGSVLGSPEAPVTLVEYADLQCPYCAIWSHEVLPALVDDYVRSGKVRIEFRGLAFIGPESDAALRAVLAAGEQNRLWDYVDLLYRNQGVENGGWVDDELLGRLGEQAGLDVRRLFVDRNAPDVTERMTSAARAADAAGVRGTPSVAIGRAHGPLRLVDGPTLEVLRADIDALLG